MKKANARGEIMKLFFDTETTATPEKSAEGDRIMIQVAGVLQKNDYDFINFETLCKPPVQEISVSAMAMHNITPEDIELEYDFHDTYVYNTFSKIPSDVCVIAHNAKFDIEVLKREGIDLSSHPVIDTLKVARFLNDRQGLPWESCSLQYLKYFFRLDREIEDLKKRLNVKKKLTAHDALSDVLDLMLLFDKFKTEFNASEKDMIELTKNPILLKYMPSGKDKGHELKEMPFNQLEWHSQNSYDENVRYTCSKILGYI